MLYEDQKRWAGVTLFPNRKLNVIVRAVCWEKRGENVSLTSAVKEKLKEVWGEYNPCIRTTCLVTNKETLEKIEVEIFKLPGKEQKVIVIPPDAPVWVSESGELSYY